MQLGSVSLLGVWSIPDEEDNAWIDATIGANTWTDVSTQSNNWTVQ
jgi:hypothetical protein